MQHSTCSKKPFNERVCSEPAFIFDNPHELGSADDMFHPYPDTGNLSIERFRVIRKRLSPAFLDRLYNCAPLERTSLISGVLIQSARNRKGVHSIGHLLVMCLSGNAPTDKENLQDTVMMTAFFIVCRFFFPLYCFFCSSVVYWMRNLPFCPVMKQYGLNFLLGKSDKRSESSLSVCAGIRPIVLWPERRICVKQCTKVLQCF